MRGNTRWASLFTCGVASFLIPFMSSSINIALPIIGAEFRLDVFLLNWVVTSFLFSLAIFLIPFGRYADIKGRGKVFMMGLTIYLFSSLASTLSNSTYLLIFSRFIQGMGGAMVSSTAIAILTSIFPPSERGKVLGINTSAVYIGLSTGPFIGGLLTYSFGWRSLFLVNIPICLVALTLAYILLREESIEACNEKFDFTGSVFYSLMLTSLIYGVSIYPSSISIPLIVIGLLSSIVFILRSLRVENPVLELGMFRNVTFTFSNIAALINYSSTYALSYLLSLYLQYLKGFNPQQTGLILSIQPIVMAIFSPLAGWLSDRIEPRIVASTGMSILTVCLFLLSSIDQQSHLTLIIAILFTLGLGFALFSSPNTNAVMSSVNKRFYGVASAVLGTMRFIGQVLSMMIVMLISSITLGRTEITPEKYLMLMLSIKASFQTYSFLCFIGILASLARGKVRS
ncbi:MAG: MFS transporter [Candidatus Methanomethylicia archaeon]